MQCWVLLHGSGMYLRGSEGLAGNAGVLQHVHQIHGIQVQDLAAQPAVDLAAWPMRLSHLQNVCRYRRWGSGLRAVSGFGAACPHPCACIRRRCLPGRSASLLRRRIIAVVIAALSVILRLQLLLPAVAVVFFVLSVASTACWRSVRCRKVTPLTPPSGL
jgi:hypothetical protein